jgi:hypothetical protein
MTETIAQVDTLFRDAKIVEGNLMDLRTKAFLTCPFQGSDKRCHTQCALYREGLITVIDTIGDMEDRTARAAFCGNNGMMCEIIRSK